MKLAIETYVPREKFGDLKGLEVIKEAGFDAVDYSFYWTKEHNDLLGADYMEKARSVRAKLDELGLECRQAHAPFDFRSEWAMDESTPAYLRIVRAIKAAAVLGVKNIIVHALVPPAGEDVIDFNVKYYRTFEPYCKKYGVCIAVENLFRRADNGWTGLLGSPAELNEVLRRLDSPWFVACIDVGHAKIAGWEPEDFILGMDPGVIQALHIQDSDGLDDRHTIPGLGRLHWDAIADALVKTHYSDDLTLEVFAYLGGFSPAALPYALKLAEVVGRELAAKVDV